MEKMAEGIAVVAHKVLREKEFEHDREFWIFTSIIVDRLFLILFIITFIVSSGSIFAMVPDHYGIF
jgi:hypothetical protein